MPPVDLLALTLTLTPLPAAEEKTPRGGTPRWWGRAAHALLLDAVRCLDAPLAEQLHGESAPRPFTVSNLLGRFAQGLPVPDLRYTLRFTSLGEQLCAVLIQTAAPQGALCPGAQVELDYLPFRIEQAQLQPASFQDLAAARLVSAAAPPRRVSLRFLSPTAFHSQERTQPLPLPDLVFGSLLERWNSFAPLAFPAEFRRYAAECLALSRFNLSSRRAELKGGGVRIGAVGDATYTALTYDRYWMGILHTLAGFARFSGVGAGTSMGLGQCEELLAEEE